MKMYGYLYLIIFSGNIQYEFFEVYVDRHMLQCYNIVCYNVSRGFLSNSF